MCINAALYFFPSTHTFAGDRAAPVDPFVSASARVFYLSINLEKGVLSELSFSPPLRGSFLDLVFRPGSRVHAHASISLPLFPRGATTFLTTAGFRKRVGGGTGLIKEGSQEKQVKPFAIDFERIYREAKESCATPLNNRAPFDGYALGGGAKKRSKNGRRVSSRREEEREWST